MDTVHVDDGSGVLGSVNSGLAQDILPQRVDNPLPHLPLDTMVDSIQNGVDSNSGLVGGLGTLLVDTGLDEDTVPLVIGLLIDGVGTSDITLGSVTDKVHGGRRSSEAMLGLAPLTHQAGGKLEGRDLRLAKGVSVQHTLAGGEVLEGDLEHAAESTHTETDVLVGSRPNDVVVGEVEWGTLIEGLAPGTKLATLRHGEVKHDLDITSPVSRISEDKDGIDHDVGEVSLSGVGMLLRSELSEGSGSGVVLDDIARGDDILEAVTLSDLTTLLALTTDDEDGAVLLSHLPHGSVAADELAGLDIALELAGEVAAALLFGLSTTISKEDVRNLHAIFILAVQDLHGLDSLGDGLSTADEDAINVKGKDERLGDVVHGRRNGSAQGGDAVGRSTGSKLRRAGVCAGSRHGVDFCLRGDDFLEEVGWLIGSAHDVW